VSDKVVEIGFEIMNVTIRGLMCRDAAAVAKKGKTVKKSLNICIAHFHESLTAEALRYGSHSFYPANTPYPLSR